jgi:hypothetical protein
MDTSALLIPELDRKGLRDFGLVTGAIVAGLFGLFFPWAFGANYPLWPWILFGVLGVWALLVPNSLKPVYRGWMRFGLLLSKVTTPIIMGAVFFLVISPMALVLRIGRWDAMHRRMDPNAESYRMPSKEAPKENLENPF